MFLYYWQDTFAEEPEVVTIETANDLHDLLTTIKPPKPARGMQHILEISANTFAPADDTPILVLTWVMARED